MDENSVRFRHQLIKLVDENGEINLMVCRFSLFVPFVFESCERVIFSKQTQNKESKNREIWQPNLRAFKSSKA